MNEILNKLEVAILKENLWETEDIIFEIESSENPDAFVEHILKIMRENEELDFGMPGPLVHFLESRNAYEEVLIASVSEHITDHTFWMIQRILSDPKETNKYKYINILKKCVYQKNINPILKISIKEYLTELLK